jgi:hypothetical protein
MFVRLKGMIFCKKNGKIRVEKWHIKNEVLEEEKTYDISMTAMLKVSRLAMFM